MQLTQLNLFPIKSTRAYGVQQAFVQPQGLNFDREFMVTEPNGQFITARKDPILYCLSAFPMPTGVVICFDKGEEKAPFGDQCLALYRDFTDSQPSEVWGTTFSTKVANEAVNNWLSTKFGRPVQLRWLGENSQRTFAHFEETPLSFADSNPILLTSQKSLAQLQKWSPIAVSMEQFRANMVIDGRTAFEEEQWQRIQIGEVTFTVVQPCTRCVLITRNLHTLALDKNVEPFRTLKQHHTNEMGKPIFGVYLVPENRGVVRLGDPIILLP